MSPVKESIPTLSRLGHLPPPYFHPSPLPLFIRKFSPLGIFALFREIHSEFTCTSSFSVDFHQERDFYLIDVSYVVLKKLFDWHNEIIFGKYLHWPTCTSLEKWSGPISVLYTVNSKLACIFFKKCVRPETV